MHKTELKNKTSRLSSWFTPHKALGQNFLRSQKTVRQIIEAAKIMPSDVIIEIGPGLGALTLPLAQKAKKIIAVEKDKRIAQVLKQMLKSNNTKNVEIINGDALKSQISNLKSQNYISNLKTAKYKVVANLPYNIATAVIMKFLEADNPPALMVVMVQKEVGQRLCAKPPHMNKLAVFAQLYSQPKIIGYVSRKCFYPKPKVDGAILKIIPNNNPRERASVKLFSQIVNAGFSHPRKQLVNNLTKELGLDRKAVIVWLQKNNIQPSQRPETLAVDDWKNLAAKPPKPL